MFKDLMQHIRQFKQESLQIDPKNRDVIYKNMTFIYHASVATEEILEEAMDEAGEWIEGSVTEEDRFYERLHEYYGVHWLEEKGELKVLREDLKSVNIEPGLPDRYSMTIIGSQYYMIKHMHPVCLLGYLAVQEADHITLAVVELLEGLYGKDFCRFARMHAERDPEHALALGKLIEEVPTELQKFVRFSADNVLEHYAEAVKTWKDKYG